MSGGEPGASTSPDMKLKIKLMNSTEHQVTCSNQDKVLDLKNKLQPLCQIPVERQRLIFRGSVLADTQGLQDARVEDGFTLHLVERPDASQQPAQPANQAQDRPQQRISLNMVDPEGLLPGGAMGLLQGLAGQLGGQMHIVTHPPIGTQDGNQIVQLVAVTGGHLPPRAPHQLTALNNFLMNLQNEDYVGDAQGPPFGLITRLGQEANDRRALLDVALASLNGIELGSEALTEFVQRIRNAPSEALRADPPTEQQSPAETTPGTMGEVAGNPRPTPGNAQVRQRPLLSRDLLSISTLALSQITSQATRHVQSFVLPTLAQSIQSLRNLASDTAPEGRQIEEEARRLSNTTYNIGSLLLELSLAATNLAQAAAGNSGPLLSAQTGFLSADGDHSHVMNHLPSASAPMDPSNLRPPVPRGGPAGPTRSTGTDAANLGARPAPPVPLPGIAMEFTPQEVMSGLGMAPLQGVPAEGGPQEVPSGSGTAPSPQTNQPERGRDSGSPFAHAFFNAITSEDSSTRHMRLPLRIGDGPEFRLDMSYVINAIEVFLLSIPPERLTRILIDINPELRGGTMRTQMLAAQSDEVRRQIFDRFAGPILDTLLPTIRTYFEQVYRVRPIPSRADQPAIRPTTRARSRTLPSLTHPFASIPNPAREALLASSEARMGAAPPNNSLPVGPGGAIGPMSIPLPGGQMMHFQLSLDELQLQDLPAALQGARPGTRQRPPGQETRPAGAAPVGVPPPQQTGTPQGPAAATGTAAAPINMLQQMMREARPAGTAPAGSAAPQQTGIPQRPAAATGMPMNLLQQMMQETRPAGAVPAAVAPPQQPQGPATAAVATPMNVLHQRVRISLPVTTQARSVQPAAATPLLTGSDLEHLANLCNNHPATVQAFLRAQQGTAAESNSTSTPTPTTSGGAASSRSTSSTSPRPRAPRDSSPQRAPLTSSLHVNSHPVSLSDNETSTPPSARTTSARPASVTDTHSSQANPVPPESSRQSTQSEAANNSKTEQTPSSSSKADTKPQTVGLPQLPHRKRPSSGTSQKADKPSEDSNTARNRPAQNNRDSVQARGQLARAVAAQAPTPPRANPAPNASNPPGIQQQLQELLNNPGQLEGLINSSQFQSLAESPVMQQMMQRIFPAELLDDTAEIEGNDGRVQGQGEGMTLDMDSMFRAMMPFAQQVMGTMQAGPSNPSNQAAEASAHNSSRPSNDGSVFPELASLPKEEQERWQKTILDDRRIQEEQEDKPFSSKYHLAVSGKNTQ